jgi:predicted nucleotidyltransferase
MRLSEAEIRALREALDGLPVEQVFLFGSRTDDARRGGDIDVLLYAHASAFALAHTVASRFARVLEAKLDVLVVDPDAPTEEQQAFLRTLHLVPLDDVLRVRAAA